MVFKYNKELFDKVKELIDTKIKLGNYTFYHGTFSSNKIKTITDVDLEDYYKVEDKDLLNKNQINKKKSKEILKEIQSKLKEIEKIKDIYFNNLLSGYDERFLFDFDIDIEGQVSKYNPDDIKKHFHKLKKDKVITTDECKSLCSKVIDKPSIKELFIFLNELEDYYQLEWTYDEIMKGSKEHRHKTFHLEDTFRNYSDIFTYILNPIVFTYVIKLKDIYLDVDSTLLFYVSDSNKININNKNFEDKIKVINNYLNKNIIKIYHGLYKNIPKLKFFKMFKRLRTIISYYLFDKKNVNNRNITIFKNIKYEMNIILNDEFTNMNQFKNRIEALLILKTHLPNNEMILLITDLLDDISKSSFDNQLEIISNKKIDYIKLKELQNKIFKYLNDSFKDIFLSFYFRTKNLINLNIPDLNDLKKNKSNLFNNELSCKSFTFSNKKSNKKYKFFKSYFEYALDWQQCKELIPMKNEHTRNTLKYLFYKFKAGTFVQIKDNKLHKLIPFYNLKYINNWSNKIKTEIKKSKNNKTKWTSLDCLIKVKDLSETSDNNLFECKNMIEFTLEKHKVKNVEFFINRKDFPLITKDGTEPQYHIWGKKHPLTSHNFEYYAPILSPTNINNEYADTFIPTNQCWQIVTQKIFPPECNTQFINKNINNRKITWKDKIETAVWRGSSTGCDVDFHNPRLLITKINKEWQKDPKLKDFLNAGITRVTKKYRFKNNELHHININKLNIELADFMSMSEQFKYKYILDIEGNSAAYRLGYLLSSKSLILKVDSPHTIWVNQFLKPKEHYLPIKRDFSDLAITIEWARKHDEACKRIADNAYKAYQRYYNEEFIGKYMSETLNNLKAIKFKKND